MTAQWPNYNFGWLELYDCHGAGSLTQYFELWFWTCYWLIVYVLVRECYFPMPPSLLFISLDFWFVYVCFPSCPVCLCVLSSVSPRLCTFDYSFSVSGLSGLCLREYVWISPVCHVIVALPRVPVLSSRLWIWVSVCVTSCFIVSSLVCVMFSFATLVSLVMILFSCVPQVCPLPLITLLCIYCLHRPLRVDTYSVIDGDVF